MEGNRAFFGTEFYTRLSYLDSKGIDVAKLEVQQLDTIYEVEHFDKIGMISGGIDVAAGMSLNIAKGINSSYIKSILSKAREMFAKGAGNTSAKGLIGKDFENFLTKNLGGNGSFKVAGREFDGRVGNTWWEAKSGGYWDKYVSSDSGFAKFKSDVGEHFSIAQKNGANFELYSNSPIPQNVKDWLIKKGIPFKEWN